MLNLKGFAREWAIKYFINLKAKALWYTLPKAPFLIRKTEFYGCKLKGEKLWLQKFLISMVQRFSMKKS